PSRSFSCSRISPRREIMPLRLFGGISFGSLSAGAGIGAGVSVILNLLHCQHFAVDSVGDADAVIAAHGARIFIIQHGAEHLFRFPAAEHSLRIEARGHGVEKLAKEERFKLECGLAKRRVGFGVGLSARPAGAGRDMGENSLDISHYISSISACRAPAALIA